MKLSAFYRRILLIATPVLILGGMLSLVGFKNGAKAQIYFNNSGFHVVNQENIKKVAKETPQFNSINLTNTAFNTVYIERSDHYGVEYGTGSDTDIIHYGVKDGTLNVTETGSGRAGFFSLSFFNEGVGSYMKIYVPQVVSFKDINIDQFYGSVSLPQITADTAEIQTKYGNVSTAGMNAKSVEIVTSDGKLTVSNIQAQSLSVSDSYGDVSLSGLHVDTLKTNMNSGYETITDSTFANADVQNKFGNIRCRNLKSTGTVNIKCGNGPLNMQNFSADTLTFENAYGDGTMDGVNVRALKITLHSGDASLTHSTFTSGMIVNEYGNIKATSVTSGGLEMHSQSGDVTVTGNLQKNTTVKSSYGAVRISNSQKRSSCTVNARTSYGNVYMDGVKQGGMISSPVPLQRAIWIYRRRAETSG